jgi:uncharacterized protein YbjT (DUF2867 family)
MAETITVLGATGRTGGSTVRALRARGVPVRAVTRQPDGRGGRALAAIGAEVVAGDMDDETSLRVAFDGIRLFNVQPAYDRRGRYQGGLEVDQGRAVARAAASAGVSHVVQLSAGRGRPENLPHFDNKLLIRRAFEQQGLPVTAIHPAPFMELMTSPEFAPALATWGVEPRIVGWERRLPWVALADIGERAASELTGPVPADGATIELIGDLRSLDDCRQLLRQAGRRVRRAPVPTRLFTAMVGTEFVNMWRWITTIAPEDLPLDPELRDVPTWIAELAPDRERAPAG